MTKLPTNIAKLTPDMMGSLLSNKHAGLVVDKLNIVSHARCGDGLASTADRVVLELAYRQGTNASDLPGRMILKTILLTRFLRFGMPMVVGTARIARFLQGLPMLGRFSGSFIFTLINVYQRYFPHAPEAMYRNEVNFYDRVRAKLDIETPGGYAAVIDDRNGQFAIAMEDLTLRAARFPNAVEGVGVSEMKGLMRTLAKLHARFWESPLLDTELNWLPRTYQGGMHPVFDAIGLDLVNDQVAKNLFKRKLIAPLNRSVSELWNATWKSQEIIYRQPHTLLHGDTHIGNTYILPDKTGGLLDWQLVVRGPWCHDVAYLMITGLSIKDRRQHEREILKVYCDTLAENGVEGAPDEALAYLLYRQSAIWGLVIGWLITPPQNYGEAITVANLEKTVTAMVDLKTLESLAA